MKKGIQNYSILESIGRGVAKAMLLFALPGMLLLSFYERMNDWQSGIWELPIVERWQSNFETGSQLIGSTFAQKAQEFYAAEREISAQKEDESAFSITENHEASHAEAHKPTDMLTTAAAEEDETSRRDAAGEVNFRALDTPQHETVASRRTKISTPNILETPRLVLPKTQIWSRTQVENHLSSILPAGKKNGLRAYLDYLETHKKNAQIEMLLHKIPASVTLAQGLLESDAGRSFLAQYANNHFGVKCRQNTTRRQREALHDDDFDHHSLAIGCEQRTDDHVWDRFEVYPSAAHSYRRHSLLLRTERYRWMIASYPVGTRCQLPGDVLSSSDQPYFAAWSRGLKKSGYATSKRYAQKLTRIIETYQLWKIDYELFFKRFVAND